MCFLYPFQFQIGQQVLGLLEIDKTETNTNRFLDILKTAMFISVSFPEQQSCNNQSSLNGQTSTVQVSTIKFLEEYINMSQFMRFDIYSIHVCVELIV